MAAGSKGHESRVEVTARVGSKESTHEPRRSLRMELGPTAPITLPMRTSQLSSAPLPAAAALFARAGRHAVVALPQRRQRWLPAAPLPAAASVVLLVPTLPTLLLLAPPWAVWRAVVAAAAIVPVVMASENVRPSPGTTE